MTSAAPTAQPTAAPRRSAGALMTVPLFMLLGCLQTLASYLLFDRSDDHAYFLDIANRGLSAVTITGNDPTDLKGQIAGTAFYVLATPSRWLGGGELTHLLWLRLLTLGGFVLAHRWVCKVIAPDRTPRQARRLAAASESDFLLLCLLYPAQLAWTASLLRDGASCTALFATLLAYSNRRWLTMGVCLLASLALRPEFVLVFCVLITLGWLSTIIAKVRKRLALLGWLIVAVSIATYIPREQSSAFGVLAFGEDGFAYPSIENIFDIKGYLMVLLQAMLDPIALSSLGGGAFFIAEVLFFTVLIVWLLRRLNQAPAPTAALIILLVVALWMFAYFEIFVGAFTRHRLALVILLLSVMSALRAMRPVRRRRRRAPATVAAGTPPTPSIHRI